MRDEGLEISEDLYSAYKKANMAKWGNSVRYKNLGRYALPFAVFEDAGNWNTPSAAELQNVAGTNFFNSATNKTIKFAPTFQFPALKGPNKGQINYRATVTAGKSIFWAPN